MSTQDPQNSPAPAFITLTQDDIDKLCQICDIAWTNYFSKPLPGYEGMKVYWNGKIVLFRQLKRNDQIKIIKSAHQNKFSEKNIDNHKNSSSEDFESFVKRFIGFNQGQLLEYHGIAHAVRTAIITQQSCQQYYSNFNEFENLNSRILFCAMSASLLHDIGRCFGGDMFDVFGSLSGEIAGEILKEVGGFSDEEIEWIKKAIEAGGLKEEYIQILLEENDYVLGDDLLIACLMGDADSYEFERFQNSCCNIEYTCIKKLNLHKKDNKNPDEILDKLKSYADDLSKQISEPKIGDNQVDCISFLREKLTILNTIPNEI